MGSYVLKRNNSVTQYILTRPILYFCKNKVWSLWSWVASILWEREVLELVVARAMSAAAAYGGEGMEV